MSDVIDVLARVGQDAKWSYASRDDVQSALTEAGIDPASQAAIFAVDQNALADRLGLVPLCGMLEPGKQDEEEDEDTEQVPPDENEKAPEHSLSQAPMLES